MFRDTDYDRYFSVGKPKPTMDDSICRGEKKRQQSRSAAKSRRLTESEVFAQLIESLPTIDQPTIYQMDRIGALRLAVALCRIRRVGERFFAWNSENLGSQKAAKSFVENLSNQPSMDACVDGFLMVVNKVGQLLYVTQGAAESIGFTQLDLVGRYLRDYVHADDWREFRDRLCNVGTDAASSIFLRMKTALTPRGGRARKLTMAVYQPLQAFIIKPSSTCRGDAFEGFDYDVGGTATAEADNDIRLIHCIPFTLSSSRRSPSSASPALTSRHDLDMRFRICDESFAHALGFKPKSFIGRSFFDLIHPEDAQRVAEAVKDMYQKCHSRTGYYRLLNHLGEPIWTMTEMLLLVQNIRGVAHKSVVCAHQILSYSKNVVPSPRSALREYLQPIKEVDLEEDYEYPPKETFHEQWDLKPMPESKSPVRNGVIPADQKWQDGTRLCQDLYEPQDSKSLAPFIPCDNHTLTPLDDAEDSDMPGLLPAHWDHWLCGNPIPAPQDAARPKTDMDKMATPTFGTNQASISNDVLPLDFADMFDMNIDGLDQFSIDEAERTFSQFAQVQESGYADLATPTAPLSPPSSRMVPVTNDGVFRKRSSTMDSSVRPESSEAAMASEHQRRMDSKTIEAFETEMMRGLPQPSYTSFNITSESCPTRPRCRSVHYPNTAVDEQKINSIQRELYRETQRFWHDC